MSRINHPLLILLLASVISIANAQVQQDSVILAQPEQTAVDSSQIKAKVNHFTLGLNLLARGEIRDGGFPADPEAENPTDLSAFILGRGRLNIGYDRPYIAAKISMQYVGTWGQGNTNTFNLYEAWARLTSKQGLFLQFGRQALAYDDERIIGPNDWTMAGNSHDALRMGYEDMVTDCIYLELTTRIQPT